MMERIAKTLHQIVINSLRKEDGMNDKDRSFVGESYLEMYESLQEAVKNSGGDPGYYNIYRLKEVKSVMDLFNALATNGVRFYCAKTHTLQEKPQITIDPRMSRLGRDEKEDD